MANPETGPEEPEEEIPEEEIPQESEQKTPQFLRKFSKERSAEERKEIAGKIKAKRREFFEAKKESEGISLDIEKKEESLSEKLKEINELKSKLDELSETGLSKILNYFQTKKLRADIASGQKSYGGLQQAQQLSEKERKRLSETISGSDQSYGALDEAKAVVDDFYRTETKKWKKTEFSKEEVKKYFSEEHLASLSLDEYELLLKRFSGKMVAHVTRQGIRDHTGMIYHIGGADEYADGFMRIVQDGRLRSPLGVQLVEQEKERALQEYLHLDMSKTKKDALNYLDTMTNPETQGGPGSYVDRIAVHFATEEVADRLYGSERGNEIFIAYPSEYIASQYYFSGQLSEQGGGNWNDQWVWANEKKGMDLNAGLVFIPAETKVDKKTGSRYELDEDKKPKTNQEYMQLAQNFVNSPLFFEISDKAFNSADQPRDADYVRERLSKEFGMPDHRLQDALLDGQHLYRLRVYKKLEIEKGQEDPYHTTSNLIEDALRAHGILFEEAKNTVNSKQFWENYFKQNPEKRPSKIVYYKGQDPTEALQRWKVANKKTSKDLGFPERHVSRASPEAISGMDRFKTLAEKAIDDYFEEE